MTFVVPIRLLVSVIGTVGLTPIEPIRRTISVMILGTALNVTTVQIFF